MITRNEADTYAADYRPPAMAGAIADGYIVTFLVAAHARTAVHAEAARAGRGTAFRAVITSSLLPADIADLDV